MDFDFQPAQIVKAIGLFLIVTIVMPVVTAGTALVSILYLPLPAPPLPKAKPGIDSRVTHILDNAGKEIGVLRKFDTSIPVERNDIPVVLKQAVVAAEDKRFYSHGGFDPVSAFRAFWTDLRGGTYKQGGSTITQQYVKNAYTTGERTLARKVREAVLASRLDRKVSKEEILYRYLSSIYLGGGAYGVGAAAQSYFKKPVKDLTVSESAMLAGLISAPSVYEPRSNPGGAEAKRLEVLSKMVAQHRISNFQYTEALAQKVFLVQSDAPPPVASTPVYPLELQSATEPFFVDYVRRYLITKYGDDLVYRGGLRVETSLDVRLEDLAEKSVAKTLNGTQSPLEMAMVTIEPTTGFVKAMVGGRDFTRSQVNLALGACPFRKPPTAEGPNCMAGGGTGRQPGSSFKPFTLAKAFEKGIGPTRVYSGPSSYTFRRCTGNGCTVKNVESGSYGGITLRQATQSSVNTVFAQLIEDVGVKDTAEMANRLGNTMVNPDGIQPSGEPYGFSLTLGVAETSPLDMAAAYGVFAARGQQFPATPVVRVTDAKGKVLEDNTARKPRRAISEAVADNVTDVLKGVVQRGTGKAADIGRPNGTAGKTGTTDDFADAWFVGFTPQLSTAVWMGYSDSNSRSMTNIKGVAKVYGGTFPAATWHDFMGEALKDVPPTDFPAPPALSGDLAAGARRTPIAIADDQPRGPARIVVPTPVPFGPPPTTSTIPRPPATLFPPGGLFGGGGLFTTTTTIPRPTTTTSLPGFPFSQPP